MWWKLIAHPFRISYSVHFVFIFLCFYLIKQEAKEYLKNFASTLANILERFCIYLDNLLDTAVSHFFELLSFSDIYSSSPMPSIPKVLSLTLSSGRIAATQFNFKCSSLWWFTSTHLLSTSNLSISWPHQDCKTSNKFINLTFFCT